MKKAIHLDRKLRLPFMILILAILLSGCGSEETREVLPSQNVLSAPTNPPVTVTNPPADNSPANNVPDYDPTAEEDAGGYTGGVYDEYGNAVYPGATPISIVPVDLPTPTPPTPVAFTYVAYSSAKLGIQFEAPVGWTVDDIALDMYKLTEPESQMRDGYQAFIEISVTTVPTTFKVSQIEEELKATLTSIGMNFASFSQRQSASRTLFDGAANGRYNQYSGKTYDGIEVSGRVHIVLMGSKLYIVHISCPSNLSDSYFKLHTQLRETLKTI